MWSDPLLLEHSDVLLLCSDGLYDLVEDEELLPLAGGGSPAESIQRLIHAANSRGGHDNITIVIEPLTATVCNIITSVAEGAELVEQVSHPNLALLADLYHMEVDNEPWANIIENAPVLKHIHLPVPELDILTTEKRPFNHELFIQTLKKTGYDGRISIEDNGKRFDDFATEAQPAAERIRELWETS